MTTRCDHSGVRAAFVILAALAASATGSISQLPGKSGCINRDGASNCVRARAVASPAAVAISADGKNVYTVSGVGSQGALAVFARNRTTGALRESGCVLRMLTRVCQTGLGLETPIAVAVAPDGKLVVTAAQNGRSVGLYRRAKNGALTPAGSLRGLDHPSGLAFRPDGSLLLVATARGIVSFLRRPSGLLERGSGPSPCDAYRGCNAVAFAPGGAEGTFAYAVSGGGAHGSISTFAVARDGRLSLMPPTAAHAIKQPFSVAVSADGKNVYVAASVSSGVAIFARDRVTGALTQTGCVTATGSQGACAKYVGLGGAWSVAVSKDGKNAYVASYGSSTVAVFARDTSGTLRETETFQPRGASRLSGVAVSPDARNVYTVGNGVAVLKRRAT